MNCTFENKKKSEEEDKLNRYIHRHHFLTRTCVENASTSTATMKIAGLSLSITLCSK
jgi:hypothetical protein